MATEKPQYAHIDNDGNPTPTTPSSPTTPSPPRTLRHKVNRALSTLTRRDPTSPDRDRDRDREPAPPTALSPTSPTSPSCQTATEAGTGKRKEPNAVKRTWSRGVAIARTRSEPALRAKRARAAAEVLAPPAPPMPLTLRSAPVTTHSRDVNAYRQGQGQGQGAVVAYNYPLWRIDPVLVGCFVCF